jgi:formate hydrogenlyase subunit 4
MNIISVVIAAVLAPFFIGIVNQTKAFFGGRRGPGILRLYNDIFKLLRKSSMRTVSSTWIFNVAQCVSLASVMAASVIFPWSGLGIASGVVPVVLFFYILAVGRLFTVLGALDAGNAFEGMGASREMQFSTLAEPVVFIILGFLVLLNGDISISGSLSGVSVEDLRESAVSLVLVFVAFYALFLLENCRVPFDDPETHLELTMIHEAMLLDVSGVDLAFALYSAALKFELLAAFLVTMFVPLIENPLIHLGVVLLGVALISLLTGIVESIMARMRFLKTPHILLGAILMSTLAVFFLVCF